MSHKNKTVIYSSENEGNSVANPPKDKEHSEKVNKETHKKITKELIGYNKRKMY
jgi:hypothetical protein